MAAADWDDISNAVEALLKDVWNFLAGLRAAHSGTWIGTYQCKRLLRDAADVIERRDRDRLSVGIVAPLHSGKSTLLNAMLGIALLPMEGTIGTKRCMTVHYTPRRKGSKLKLLEPSGKVSAGSEAVKGRLHDLLVASSADDWQSEPPLELNAAFCKSLGAEDEIVKFDVTEMPPLTSIPQHSMLREQLRRGLETLDVIIVALDYTKLRSSSEADIVQDLKETFPNYSPQLGHRLIFCVTKADVSIDADDSIRKETQQYVATLLQEAGFQSHPTKIYVLSPLQALLSRLVIADKHDPDVYEQFASMVWGEAPESISDKTVWKTTATKLLELSGVPKFEEEVLGSLYRNAEGLRLLSLVDDSIQTLQWASEAAYGFKTTSSRTLHETRQAMDNAKTQLETGFLYLTAAKSQLQQIEKDVAIKVREVLTKLKNSLLNRIGNGLAEDGRSNVPVGWMNLRRDFLALTHHIEPDRTQAEALVKELHEEVIGQIRSEVDVAWTIIEDLARDRHFEFVFKANQDLDHLSKLLESIVIKDLNIQIEPAKVQLKPIDIDRFDRGQSELIEAAIKEHKVDREGMSSWILGRQYSVHFFDGGSIREFYENIVREISNDAMGHVESTVKRHVAGQVATSEEKLKIYGEMFSQGLRSAIEARGVQINSSTTSMQRVIEDLETMKKLKTWAMTVRRRIESGLSYDVTTSQAPDLQIRVSGGSDGEAPDTVKYVPPRSRSIHESPKPTVTDGFTLSELEMTESPASHDHWRIGRSGSGTRAAAQTPNRHRQPQSQSPSGENFNPTSNFFRNFQQTPRRGRGHETPNRAGSWTG